MLKAIRYALLYFKAPKVLNGTAALALCLVLASWHFKNTLPSKPDLAQELYTSPIQKMLRSKPSTMPYKGLKYIIQPKAHYELYGLVVSHNNTDAWWDIFHDEQSLDTKDICIIWGENLKNGDYNKVSFHNTSWSCIAHYPQGVSFIETAFSNNHLITHSLATREKINALKVGDQIKIRGKLVDYKTTEQTSQWRVSSLRRNDTGNGACEVVFVHTIELLNDGNRIWHLLYEVAFTIFLIAGALRIFLHFWL